MMECWQRRRWGDTKVIKPVQSAEITAGHTGTVSGDENTRHAKHFMNKQFIIVLYMGAFAISKAGPVSGHFLAKCNETHV
jgi:hypothetical protein